MLLLTYNKQPQILGVTLDQTLTLKSNKAEAKSRSSVNMLIIVWYILESKWPNSVYHCIAAKCAPVCLNIGNAGETYIKLNTVVMRKVGSVEALP